MYESDITKIFRFMMYMIGNFPFLILQTRNFNFEKKKLLHYANKMMCTE